MYKRQDHYPSSPYITTQGNVYNWYEYDVYPAVIVIVNNGTNPVTLFANKLYTSRQITTTISFMDIWSSKSYQNATSIITYDTLNVGNYSVSRIWHAGNIVLTAQQYLQQSGNTYNYYLSFNLIKDVTEPPTWIYQKMPYNPYATQGWYYLEQNATLANALMRYVNQTMNSTDVQYKYFEYFTLASEFASYTFNTTYSKFANTIELESFYDPWVLMNVQILDISKLPNAIQYFPGQLMFFNVSRIPAVYNATNLVNISGNYEIYWVDLYNSWNGPPFGNEYQWINLATGQKYNLYLFNETGIPYPGEMLTFYNADFMPSIYYAIFIYPEGTVVKIEAVWNGTAWIS